MIAAIGSKQSLRGVGYIRVVVPWNVQGVDRPKVEAQVRLLRESGNWTGLWAASCSLPA